MILLKLLIIALAAILKASADVMAHYPDTSVFSKWNPKFWNKDVAATTDNIIPGTRYRLDGWHLANSGMILAFILAAVLPNGMVLGFWLTYSLFVASGCWFVMVFNLFYDKILRKQQK